MPLKQVKPGQERIPARQLNDIARRADTAADITADWPIEVSRRGTGRHIRWARLPDIWVRITGQGTGDPINLALSTNEDLLYSNGDLILLHDSEGPPFHYSAIQQLDRRDIVPACIDLVTGLVFDADVFPLVEVNDREDVEIGRVYRAFPGMGGDYYSFDAGGPATPDWTPPLVMTHWTCTGDIASLTKKYICADGSLVDDPGDCG